MRMFTHETARTAEENGLQIGRWTQYPAAAGFPFGAMWYTVPPGAASEQDVHPELELAVVVAGRARFVAPDGTGLEAGVGAAVLLDSAEPHVVENLSDADPVTVLSVYWMPDAVAGAAADPADGA